MVLENDRNSTFFPRISLLKLLTCLFFVIKSPNFIASCDALSCPLSIVYMLLAKLIPDCFGFASLRNVIGPEKLANKIQN